MAWQVPNSEAVQGSTQDARLKTRKLIGVAGVVFEGRQELKRTGWADGVRDDSSHSQANRTVSGIVFGGSPELRMIGWADRG